MPVRPMGKANSQRPRLEEESGIHSWTEEAEDLLLISTRMDVLEATGSFTPAGAVGGSGGPTKTGEGTLILAGSNI